MPSLYTFTQKTPPSETSGTKDTNKFGNQQVDGARISIQGLGNGFQTTDASSTALTSPLTLTSTATTVNIPQSAIQVTLHNSGATNPLSYSEVSGMASYATLTTGQSITLDIGLQGKLYLSSASGTTCDFVFTVV
jgi:hypothetical protein